MEREPLLQCEMDRLKLRGHGPREKPVITSSLKDNMV